MSLAVSLLVCGCSAQFEATSGAGYYYPIFVNLY